MKVSILTDFAHHDPAYSLCGVVMNQTKQLDRLGVDYQVIVKTGFIRVYSGDIRHVSPGPTDNKVVITERSEAEIDSLAAQLDEALADSDVVLTHDLIYQPAQWKYHVAARRVAAKRPSIRWLHWVHSATNLNVKAQMNRFKREVDGKFPNSRLVVMHQEELIRKASMYGYEPDQTVIIPNAIDLTEYMHPAAIVAIEKVRAWEADITAVYPCRLDRGKQPHIIIEILDWLEELGYSTRLFICDFHSTSGDKETYRYELAQMARKTTVHFTGQLPHRAVGDLMQFSDIFIHPSTSESDPLILQEAMWAKCALVLNFDLPLMHQYEGTAVMGKFSSQIDITTGLLGETRTNYSDRVAYMGQIARKIAYFVENNPVIQNHIRVRKERGLDAVARKLFAALV